MTKLTQLKGTFAPMLPSRDQKTEIFAIDKQVCVLCVFVCVCVFCIYFAIFSTGVNVLAHES